MLQNKWLKIVSLLFALVCITVGVVSITSPTVTYAQGPSVNQPEVHPHGSECSKDLYFHASGFAANSPIMVTNTFNETVCQTGKVSGGTWGPIHGATSDSGGYFIWGTVNSGTGTYHYVFSDNAGQVVNVYMTTNTDGSVASYSQQSNVASPPAVIPSGGTMPDARNGNGVHMSIYCEEKGWGNSVDPVDGNAYHWKCEKTGYLDMNQVCRDVWGGSYYAYLDQTVNPTKYGWRCLQGKAPRPVQPTAVPPQATNPPSVRYPNAQLPDGGISLMQYCKDIGFDVEQHSEGDAYSFRCVKDQQVWYINWNQACYDVWGNARRYPTLSDASNLGAWKCSPNQGYIDPPRQQPVHPTIASTSNTGGNTTRTYPVAKGLGSPFGQYYAYVPSQYTSLFLRSTPDARTDRSNVMGIMNPDDYFTIFESNGDWVRIDTSLGQGWVFGEYVRITDKRTDNSDPKKESEVTLPTRRLIAYCTVSGFDYSLYKLALSDPTQYFIAANSSSRVLDLLSTLLETVGLITNVGSGVKEPFPDSATLYYWQRVSDNIIYLEAVVKRGDVVLEREIQVPKDQNITPGPGCVYAPA